MKSRLRAHLDTRVEVEGLNRVEDSVKAAYMGPHHVTFPTRPNAPAVIAVVGVTCLPEIILTLLETSAFGSNTDFRRQALMLGAFWSGLLADWQPLFPFQRESMFVSYALLHGGFLHLMGNMIAALALGGIAVARIGQRGFLLLYALSAVGGALGFAALSSSQAPMIGASGAVFGLIGAWKFWEWQIRQHLGSSMRPLWRSLAGLALLNVILWVALSGLVAWEAHLGGFIAGVIFAAIVTPSLRYRV